MATVAHTIYSVYEPKKREIPNSADPEDKEDPWQTESSLGAQRRALPPPYFVPAVLSYDDWGTEQALARASPEDSTPRDDLAEWYKTLTSDSRPPELPISAPASDPSQDTAKDTPPSRNRHTEKRTKNNWFIMKAIQSEPPPAPTAPSPTLADILARDPPPLPSQEQFKPPVFLAIGPSNKGFAMLQRSGWNEGEALGPNIVRRKPTRDILSHEEMLPTWPRSKAKVRGALVKQEELEVKWEDGDISEVRQVEVIDLTLSDSESDASDTDLATKPPPLDRSPPLEPNSSAATYTGKALLTPIPTILKSDRLGLGLKAKTVGPYKASQKRVTHNAAALAAHIKHAEDLKKRKNEIGRGRRGFERARKKEEEKRKKMLAYLKE